MSGSNGNTYSPVSVYHRVEIRSFRSCNLLLHRVSSLAIVFGGHIKACEGDASKFKSQAGTRPQIYCLPTSDVLYKFAIASYTVQ